MTHKLLSCAAAAALLGTTGAAPPHAAAPTAAVVVTSSPNTDVCVIAPVAAVRARVGGGARRGDTLFARTPLRFDAALAGGGVRIEATGAVPVKVEAEITGGSAARFAGSGSVLQLGADGGEIVAPARR